MERLQHLVQCLKPSEVQFVRDFYRVKYKDHHHKRSKLFELLIESKVDSNAQACQVLYESKNDSAFSHLKKSLEEDLLNFILLAPTDDQNSADGSGNEIKCRRTFLQGKILLARGMKANGISLLQKTSKLAERYEFPDLNLAACDMLRKYQGISKHKYYNDTIHKAFKLFGKILKAKEINYNTGGILVNGNESNPQISGAALRKLSDRFQPEESKRAYFWYEMALIEHFIKEQNYRAANNFAQQLIEYMDLDSVLNCAVKKSQVLLKLAETYVQLGAYQQALAPAKFAMELQANNSSICSKALQLQFYAYLHQVEYTKAEAILQKALVRNDLSGTHNWAVLEAGLYFSLGNYAQVGKTLNQTNCRKDQSNCVSLRIRLLELLNILELQDYDWFEYKIDTFRKKIRTLKSTVCPRLPQIYHLLKWLMRHNYQYQHTALKQDEHLSQLHNLHWDPMGYELINFGDWLQSKAH